MSNERSRGAWSIRTACPDRDPVVGRQCLWRDDPRQNRRTRKTENGQAWRRLCDTGSSRRQRPYRLLAVGADQGARRPFPSPLPAGETGRKRLARIHSGIAAHLRHGRTKLGSVQMETEPALKTPPPLLERLVLFFIPPAARETVAGDLCELYRSPLDYAASAARTVPFVLASQ